MLIDHSQRSATTEASVHRVLGEVDIATVAALRSSLGRTIDSSAGPVVLDLSGMTFIDAAGLRGLEWFGTEMQARGRRASVCGPRPLAARLLTLTGLDRLLEIEVVPGTVRELRPVATSRALRTTADVDRLLAAHPGAGPPW